MKKVLIIDLFPHNYLGGGQKYTRELIKIFIRLNFKITILSFWNLEIKNNYNEKDDINKIFIFNKKKGYKNLIIRNLHSIYTYICAKNYLKKYLENNEFNLLIDNCSCISIGKKYKNKSIFVQHVDEKILFNKCRNFIWKFFCIRPSFYDSYINVVYTEANKNIFSKKIKNSIIATIPLFVENNTSNITHKKNSNNNSYITYVGRTDTTLKNINLLGEISSLLNVKIHVIGNYSPIIKKLENEIIYEGEKTHDETMDFISKNSSCIILTSDSEGLSFIILEAFSLGKPVIVRDTFTNARYLVSKERGILLEKNMKATDIVKIINKINWNSFKSDEIRNFVLKEFSRNNFEDQWIKILNNF